MRSVDLLTSSGVTDLVVAGLGSRPLRGFQGAGVKVHFEDSMAGVEEAVEAVISGGVRPMDNRLACRGH